MAKPIYKIEGTAFTRQTNNIYTHAVILTRDDEAIRLLGCCSTLGLAQKLMSSKNTRCLVEGFEGNVKAEIREMILK